jgi:hypothetical protein
MIIVFLLTALGVGYYGQHVQKEAKSLYIKSMNVTFGKPSSDYDFKSAEDNNSTFKYEPEVANYMGLGIDTEYFGLGVEFTDGVGDKKPDESDYRSPSNVYDIQVSGIKDQVLWDIYYQKYSGLYIEKEFDQNELVSTNFGFGFLYAFESNIEAKKILKNLEHQKQTGYSWLVGASVNRNILKSTDEIVPGQFSDKFKELQNIDKIETNSFSLDLGWGGQYIWNNVFINGLVTIGLVYQEQKLFNKDYKSYNEPASSNNIELGFGYKLKRGLTGLSAKFQTFNTKLAEQEINQSRTKSYFYYRHFF